MRLYKGPLCRSCGRRVSRLYGWVNVAGFHLHFIADDRRRGGHLLDFSAGDLVTAIDETEGFYMALPHDPAFGRAEIGKTNETAVGIIEK